MSITVTIITRNRADQLKRCLKSLVRQTNKKFTVIVVDNGSSDKTRTVVECFKKDLKISYRYERRAGSAFARNKSLESLKGDIMATIDDDCEADSNWIDCIIKSHKKNKDIFAITGWSISEPKENPISIIAQFIQESAFKNNIVSEHNFFYKFNKNFLNSTSKMLIIDGKNTSFKISTFKVHNLTFNTKWSHSEDLDFSKLLLSKGEKILFDPSIVVHHWEPSIKQFLKQRFNVGSEVMKAQLNWPRRYFPKRKSSWWAFKIFDFFLYLGRNKHIDKMPILLPLFILERSTTILGRYKEYIKLNLLSKPLSL